MTADGRAPPDNIGRWAAWIAERHPDAPALVIDDACITYADLAARVDSLAAALRAHGVRPGDRIATLQTPHPDFVPILLATAAIGAIWVGMNPRYRRAEMEHVIEDARPSVLFARSAIAGRSYADELAALRALHPAMTLVGFPGQPLAPGQLAHAEFLAGGAETPPPEPAPGGRLPCLLVYTSGSTGRPKGALLHHSGIRNFCLAQNAVWPLDPLRVLNFLPINHVGCIVDITLPALLAGGCVVFMEQFEPGESLRIMRDQAISFWGSVPSVFALQMAHPAFDPSDLSAVRLIVWEGAAMAGETIARLRPICPRLATNYGMTETTSAVTVLEPTDDLELLANSVGGAFPGADIRLVDPDGRPVGDGEAGEIQVRSENNMLGYWNNPDATAAAFTADGYLRTGDLAVRRPDGRYRIVGRLKEMFKSGGHNIYPREVEAAIEAMPGVVQAAVVSAPDPLWQEVGVAFVEAGPGVTEAGLRAWCAGRLANYKVPKRFHIGEALPLLPIGKVDRTELRRRAEAMA